MLLIATLTSSCTVSQTQNNAKSQSSFSSCPNWENDFNKLQYELTESRKQILEMLNSKTNQQCSASKNNSSKDEKLTKIVGLRIEQMQIPVADPLSKSLAKFSYVVIPPKVSIKNKPLKTIFFFAGGPGNIYSDALERMQLEHYQVVIADYIGMGMNQISPLFPGIGDQFMNLENYAVLIEKLIRKEVDAHQIGRFVLVGGSFGSVGATVVGSHLSKLQEAKYRPSLVLLSLIMPFADQEHRDQTNAQTGYQIEWTPRKVKEKICILPQGPDCFDDIVLEKLTLTKRQAATKAIENAFENFNANKQTSLQRFFRDAFHWEVAQQPKKAADFLNQAVHDDGSFDFEKLHCWFEKEYDHLPWNHRYRTASFMASIESHSCQSNDTEKEFHCSCFTKQTPYTAKNFQISDPVPVIYVNGTEDSQTSLTGAMKHYDSQRKTEKKFFKLCGLGHEVFQIGKLATPGQIDRMDLIAQFFTKGLRGIKINIPNCSSSRP